MTNPNTAPSADSDGGAIDDPFSQARLMRWGKALQAEGNSLGDALVAYADSWSQDWAEAVAPEAKPEWPKGAFFTDGEGNFYDEQAEPLDHAFAPPAPPAPLPGKRERALFQAWARDRHWNLSLRADGERYMSESTQEGWYAWKGRAALSAQAAPEYRTGFDEAPSTFNQEDAAPADYPPPDILFDSYAVYQALSDKAKARTSAENVADVLDAIVRAQRSGVSADPLPRPLLTDLEIQGLRRQARNDPRCADQHWFILMVRAIESYYGVTGAAAQSQPLVEPTAARVSFLLEQKSALPHWENLMAYQSEDSARKALPVFRKTTSRDIRIVRQTREVVAVDSVAASPPQHQVKKGEPS